MGTSRKSFLYLCSSESGSGDECISWYLQPFLFVFVCVLSPYPTSIFAHTFKKWLLIEFIVEKETNSSLMNTLRKVSFHLKKESHISPSKE